ncbi:hypothetical protein GC176_21285 [bacterium]|nr:hypothetical protein [bacterium]
MLDHDIAVSGATTDFRRTPYSDGFCDHQPDVANLSENLVSQPYQDLTGTLKAGVHLHWALPTALSRTTGGRRARHEDLLRVFGGDADFINHLVEIGLLVRLNDRWYSIMPTALKPISGRYARHAATLNQSLASAVGGDFFPVPNRWLVTRRSSGRDQSWVVESDYVGQCIDGKGNGGVSIPIDAQVGAPFRTLGRCVPLEAWAEDPDADRFSPLTSAGFGTPTFAALYPNSHSVFGLYDPLPACLGMQDAQYDVIGWYSDGEDDFIGCGIAEYVARFARDAGEAPGDEVLRKYLTEELLCVWPSDAALPDRCMCCGRIDVRGGAEQVATPNPDHVRLAIGHTGVEAISTFIASEIDPELKNVIEDQLEAIQLESEFENRRLDVGLKFRESRHSNAFSAETGSELWVLRKVADPQRPAQADEVDDDLPTAYETALLAAEREANRLQRDYDSASARLDSLRKLLFADWYKYMSAAYPPEGSRDQYPDLDELRTFIEIRTLNDIKNAEQERGTLVVTASDLGVTGAAAPGSAEGSIASSLASAVTELVRLAAAHNGEIEAAHDDDTVPGRRLTVKRVPGPRYWRPNEPVAFLTGEQMQATPRYSNSPVDCGAFQAELPPATAGDTALVRDRLSQELIETEAWTLGRRIQQSGDWHPLILEWQVEVFPLLERGNIHGDSADYDPGFITANYRIDGDACEYALREGGGRTVKGANTYRGQSILSPQSGNVLRDAVGAFLSKRLVPLYNKDNPSEKIPELDGSTRPHRISASEAQGIEKWYSAVYLAEMGEQERAQDGLYTAIRAYRRLLETTGLSQALSGFNDALLMHRQTYQLHIADPLGFEEYREFTDQRVREAVGRFNRVAPEPLNDFNPIRSGAMTITSMRLLDSFGRASDNLALHREQIVASNSMINPTSTYPIFLKPAITQPARMSFRFLSASQADAHAGSQRIDSPICGWVMPNYLDKSLVFFDTDGHPLGSIFALQARTGAEARWEPPPGDGGCGSPGTIADPHLRLIAGRLTRLGAEYVGRFLGALESAIDGIHPESAAHHSGVALLVSRPLAVVRGELGVELLGDPAVHHGWLALLGDVQGVTRETNAFQRVEIPIRLGEHGQLNDGLIGYWIEGHSQPDVFWVPPGNASADDQDDRIRAGGNGSGLVHSLAAAPLRVAMLLDPRGSVHATTGLLPTKEISIPPEKYAAALSRIHAFFFTTPILTAGDRTAVMVPHSPGQEWVWIERHTDGLSETQEQDIQLPPMQVEFPPQLKLKDGWLRLTTTNPKPTQTQEA